MASDIVLTAKDEYVNITVRDFLRRSKISAAYMHEIKQSGEYITVNGEKAYSATRLCGGDTVRVPVIPESDFTDIAPQNLGVEILYEDDCAIVFDKPPYMAVHPTLGYKDATLANHFCFLMQQRGQRGVFRPLNRLDRNTSGAVLCAKHRAFAPFLQSDTKKEYICMVEGRVENGGTITAPIARCADSIIKRCVDKNGKPAVTEYGVVKATDEFSVLSVRPKTGRTHQIRVHMAYISHPLLGDGLYGGNTSVAARHFLHCSDIEFLLPTFEKVHIHSPICADMLEFCEKRQIFF